MSPTLAGLLCSGTTVDVEYFLYPDNASMDADFSHGAPTFPQSDDCAQTQNWPAEGTWSIGGQPVGRVWCKTTTIAWTHDRLLISATATAHSGVTNEELYDIWKSGDLGPH